VVVDHPAFLLTCSRTWSVISVQGSSLVLARICTEPSSQSAVVALANPRSKTVVDRRNCSSRLRRYFL
jgi:hypothetical protein